MSDSRFAFEDLLQQAQGPLLGYLIRLTGSVHVAQDLLQAANVTAIEKQKSFCAGTDFDAWIRQIARNHYRNAVRKQAVSKTVLLVDDGLHEVIERRHRERLEQQQREADWDRLQACLQTLPIHQRELVQQFYIDGQSLDQLAKATGRNANAIGQTLHRARRALIQCVKFAGDQPPQVAGIFGCEAQQGAETR